MDGINGIAGITGIVAFGLLAYYASFSGLKAPLDILAICILLACAGFLPFNMPRARVFMGDVGSILLGFVFAGMVVYLSKSVMDFICLSAFLFPFYADELTTMIVRLKNGENLTKPRRSLWDTAYSK
jgi:Fuc2NAc and GlcNAc transferase